MSQRFLLLFIIIPIIELYLLISVGSVIGVIPTILLIIITAIIGVQLLKAQGMATLQRLQNELNQGVMPAEALVEGILLLVGGALLLTPGFFTDALGFSCLIPQLRLLWVKLFKRYSHHVMKNAAQGQAYTHSYSSHTSSHTQQPPRHTTVIDGEFKREDD